MRNGRTGNLAMTGVVKSIEGAISSCGQVLELVQKLAENMVSREEFLGVASALSSRIEARQRPSQNQPGGEE